MPSWVLASVSPLYEVWLNDLSSNPPESETMHALNPAPPAEALVLALVVGAAEVPVPVPGASAQPANIRPAALTIAAAVVTFLRIYCLLGMNQQVFRALGSTALPYPT